MLFQICFTGVLGVFHVFGRKNHVGPFGWLVVLEVLCFCRWHESVRYEVRATSIVAGV